MTMQISILNPKATKLLEDLADLNLIAIQAKQRNPTILSEAVVSESSLAEAWNSTEDDHWDNY